MMLYMFKIQRIDVNNENAKNNFFTSFQNTGFAVMENHGISFELIDKEEGILKELELEEEIVNNMIMEARSFWSEEQNKD